MGVRNRRPLYTEQELAEQRQKAADAAAADPQANGAPQASTSATSAPAGSTRSATIAISMPPPTMLPQQQQQLQMLDPSQPQPTGPQQPLLITDFEQPCTLKGLGSACYAGLLGYFFGVVPAVVKHRVRMWGLVHQAGMKSATQLALMSGLYTAVHCIATRIRQKDDGWSRGVAGCSTGLVLGWGGGPMSAAQSCVAIGAISYVLDFGGAAAPEAHAAVLGGTAGLGGTAALGSTAVLRSRAAASALGSGAQSSSNSTGSEGGASAAGDAAAGMAGQKQAAHKLWQQQQRQQQPLEQLLGAALGLPSMIWLGHCCQAQQGRRVAMGVDACPLSTAAVPPAQLHRQR